MNFPHLEKVMEEYAMYLLNSTKSNLPDTYRIKSKLNFVFEIDGNFYEIVFHTPDYFRWIENGRGPGKNPPIKAIEDWITIKHITKEWMLVGISLLAVIHSVNVYIPRTQPHNIQEIKHMAIFPNFSMLPATL